MNRCYQDANGRYLVSNAHQSGFCFTANHSSCPAYRSGWAGATSGIREAHSARPHGGNLPAILRWASPYWSQLVILFVLVATMLATLMMAAPSGVFGSQDENQSPTATATLSRGLH